MCTDLFFLPSLLKKKEDITQGEGGEQGDLLMPMLFAWGPRGLADFRRAKRCSLMWTTSARRQEVSARANIQFNLGTTQVWNRGGTALAGIEALTAASKGFRPDAVVWIGDIKLPAHHQGLKVLDPIGVLDQEIQILRVHPFGGGPPMSLALVVHVWRHEGTLFVADMQPDFVEELQHGTMKACGNVCGNSWIWVTPCLFVWEDWVGKRHPGASWCSLGELGRPFPDGAEAVLCWSFLAPLLGRPSLLSTWHQESEDTR